MLETLKLNHVALPAADPETLKQWYCNNLGLTPHGHHLWSHGTVLAITKGTPLPNDDWHFGFWISSKDALEQWHVQLQSKGLNPSELKGNNYYQSFYLRDPEGNDIEFFWENPPQ